METSSSNEDDRHHLKRQEEKLKAKYGGMIPKKNLIVSDRKHFDSADYWSRGSNTQQQQVRHVETDEKNAHFGERGADSSRETMLKPVLGAKDVAGLGTSPPSDASTFTNNNSQTKRRTSMDESRGRWDVHSFNNNNNNNTAVNSAYHAPKNRDEK